MRRQDWATAVIGIAAFAYAVYGMFTGSGAVGWVNSAQQSLFGSYSPTLSLVVVLTGLLLVGTLLWSQVERLAAGDGGSTEREAQEPARGPAPATTGSMLWIWAVLVAATWGLGYGWYAWSSAAQRGDASAHYEPIVLRDAVAAPQPTGTHLALQGRLVGDRILTHRSSGDSASGGFHLVPIVSPGWSAGQPVSYIVKVENLGELETQGQALLARLDGDVPVAAAQEFRKMGVAITSGSHLLRAVPSRDGRPAVRDTTDEYWTFFVWACAGLSGLLTLALGGSLWAMRRAARLAAGATARSRAA